MQHRDDRPPDNRHRGIRNSFKGSENQFHGIKNQVLSETTYIWPFLCVTKTDKNALFSAVLTLLQAFSNYKIENIRNPGFTNRYL